jgi:hypothetical protein
MDADALVRCRPVAAAPQGGAGDRPNERPSRLDHDGGRHVTAERHRDAHVHHRSQWEELSHGRIVGRLMERLAMEADPLRLGRDHDAEPLDPLQRLSARGHQVLGPMSRISGVSST